MVKKVTLSSSLLGSIFVFATILIILNAIALGSMAASSSTSVGATATQSAGDGPTVPILIKFKASASSADIDNALHSAGGQSVRDLKQIRTHVINVPANARDRILAAYAKHPSVERATAAVGLKMAGTPNDQAYAQQWALPKIAWDQAYGNISISGSAKLAVLDTGVDAAHPDLTSRMIAGQSFVNSSPNTDPNGHGTALAGIAAADANNAVGIAGVSYAATNIMSVQVLQANGTGYDSDVVAGVLWAADNGANVILMGFSSPDYSAPLADALAYAWNKSVVLVAATGNDGTTNSTYPAGMANVIGVAATDENDNLTASSNTGSALVAAPGVNIYTTLPGVSYGSVGGTSAASAHVAGLAALLAANGSSNGDIYNQILGATDPVSGMPFGRINMVKALGAQVAPLPTPVVTATPTPGPTPTYVAGALGVTAMYDAPNTTINAVGSGINTNNKVYQYSYTPPGATPGFGSSFFNSCTSGTAAESDSFNIAPHFAIGDWNVTLYQYKEKDNQGNNICANDGSNSSKKETSVSINVPVKRLTSTSLNLNPSSVVVGQTSTATVNVTDITTGTKIYPTGTVAVTSDSGDTITGTCSLSKTTTSGVSTCSVTVTPTSIGTGTHTITANFSETSIHYGSNGSATLTVSKAPTATVVNSSLNPSTYGQSVTFTANVTSTGGAIPNGETVTFYDGSTAIGSNTTSSGNATFSISTLSAGSHTITANYTGDTNFATSTSSTLTQIVNKATASIAIINYTTTYDGNPHTATGTATGVKGETLIGLDLSGTTHTNAGDYPSDSWTFTDPTGNYINTSGIVHDIISKATVSIIVTNYSVTYNGSAHTATGTATGVNSVDLSSDLDLSSTIHTNAGNYPFDQWTFIDLTGNYVNTSGTVDDTISKATASITVTNYSVTFDGSAHTATGSATGVKNIDLSSDLDLTGTIHTNAGDYPSDGWTFTDLTGNYVNTSGTVDDTISKATASIIVTNYSVTFDGNAYTASGSATGVGGANLNSDLDLSGTTHTNAGDYPSDAWTFTDITGNYVNTSGTADDTISKATASIAITNYTTTYDGNPHTATGTATGVKEETLTGLDLSGTTHTNAGDYPSDGWTFTDLTGNYVNTSGTVHDTISKATASIIVTNYSVTFDGNVHTASGTAIGVNSVDLSSDLDLSGTTHTNAGDYPSDPWTFTDLTGNYVNTSGTVHDTISKATASITVTNYSVTYDGDAHNATGSATGVKNIDISSDLDLTGTIHTNAGDYPSDPWTFTDLTGNYINTSGTVHDTISKATASIAVTNYTTTYDGNPHTATGTATGVNNANLNSDLDLSDTTHTNAGDYLSDSWTFTDLTGNYINTSGAVHDIISKATASITVNNYSVTFDGSAHTATGSATGVKNIDISSDLDLSGTTHTNAGDYPSDGWTFTDLTGNYVNTSGTVHDTISKATPTVTTTLNQTMITLGGSVNDTVTVTGVPGTTPTGKVDFQVSNNSETTWMIYSPGVSLSGGQATSAGYKPMVAGIYYFRANYSGDINYTTNHSVNLSEPLQVHATTSLLYNGQEIVNTNSTLLLGAKLSSSASICVGPGNIVNFSLDTNPLTGVSVPSYPLGSATTDSSGQATLSILTTNWLEGTSTITANFTGTSSCNPSSDFATLTVATPGEAANGGGWYTLSGNGRVNFGFTVRKWPPNNINNTYKGQLLLINNGKWRLKGNLSSYSKASTTNASASGTGDLFWWNQSLNGGLGDWNISQSGVSYAISFTDTGQGGKNSYDTFGIIINHAVSLSEPGTLPNSLPVALKGGNIVIN